MKNTLWKFIFITMSIFLAASFSLAEDTDHPARNLLDISFPTPKDTEQQKYLGIEGGEEFKISQVDARVVVVEIFSMYCPYCQREAPRVNELYEKMQTASPVNGSVKIIGIGAGNSAYEVELFREAYQIPFPLFSDGDYTIHERIGSVRTPFFIVFRKNEKNVFELNKTHLGPIKDLDQFLEEITERSVPSNN